MNKECNIDPICIVWFHSFSTRWWFNIHIQFQLSWTNKNILKWLPSLFGVQTVWNQLQNIDIRNCFSFRGTLKFTLRENKKNQKFSQTPSLRSVQTFPPFVSICRDIVQMVSIWINSTPIDDNAPIQSVIMVANFN